MRVRQLLFLQPTTAQGGVYAFNGRDSHLRRGIHFFPVFTEARATGAQEAQDLCAQCEKLEGDLVSLKDILESESLEVESLQVCVRECVCMVCVSLCVCVCVCARARVCVSVSCAVRESGGSPRLAQGYFGERVPGGRESAGVRAFVCVCFRAFASAALLCGRVGGWHFPHNAF